ncbi:MAG TPA: Hpt domain-containing protein [Candidatus Bathyarchaeia archaeon]|nr:Hpt domain-containing protein [Candidatus Bathyarchaeia archaeon]
MQEEISNGTTARPRVDAVNPQIMRKVVGDDPEMIRVLIAEFLPGARSGIAEIGEAVGSGLADRVRASSHKLKGACAMVGARHLIEICVQLEAAARAEEWRRIEELFAELDPHMSEVEVATDLLLREMPAG